MTKSKNTKRALLMSILSMMLCVAMLIGSTFAWFTDSVTSGKNQIVAGNLDIELEYATEFNDDGTVKTWTPVTAATELFSALEKDGTANLWEPGHTEYVCLRVSNVGTLALKYQFDVNVYGDAEGKTPEKTYINKDGDEFKLSNSLVFIRKDGAKKVADRESLWISDAAAEKKAMGDLSGLGLTSDKMVPGGEKVVTLAVYMPTQVGNEANYKTGTDRPEIYLGLSLKATQTPHEEDSFGNTYDEDAAYSTKKIVDSNTLLKESSKTSNAPINLQLANDIDASEPVIAVAENSTVNVDFDGNDLNINAGGITAVQSAPGATLTLSNGSIICPYDVDSTAAVQLFSAEEESDAPVPFISANGGTLILENMLVLTPHASYVVSTGVDGTLLIKDSTINSTHWDKGAVLVESGATATIDAGTESIAGTLTVIDDGTLIIMSGLFTDEPFDYLYCDDNGYSESSDEPNNDGFYEVVCVDVGDFEDPFGDDFEDPFGDDFEDPFGDDFEDPFGDGE